ncbi:ligand-gated ion channel [Legionella saoudiensis]|uniref:hypothetical protein n=1 Tax=Legionella saoudiensis TaxID=1750561 RepID=UPI00072FA22C|nr:hypothetical protein [Legionella saoudiensis]
MKKVFLIVLMSWFIFPVWAAPNVVTFGVYPLSIYDVDPANGTFSISYYAWWRTTDKNYNPTKNIEIVNARDYTHKLGASGKVGNEYYTSVHYYAKIHQPWDSKNFPFGRKFLTVKMEDFADDTKVVFQPDNKESRLHSEFTMPGWNIIGMSLVSSVIHYATNFGNEAVDSSSYSRLSFIIEVKRQGWKLYISYFIGFFMAGILAHLLYTMSSLPFAARATVFIGSVVAFIGNKYIIDPRLPPTPSYGLADAIQMITFLTIIISIFVSIGLELKYPDEKKRAKISLTIGTISLIIYVLYIIIYTWRAVAS